MYSASPASTVAATYCSYRCRCPNSPFPHFPITHQPSAITHNPLPNHLNSPIVPSNESILDGNPVDGDDREIESSKMPRSPFSRMSSATVLSVFWRKTFFLNSPCTRPESTSIVQSTEYQSRCQISLYPLSGGI
jgi:hypothetical protein